jgi:lipopolysaccharide transport protein LptA
MANLFLERLAAAVAVVALQSGAAGRITGTIDTGPGRMPINYECDRTEVDYLAHQMHLQGKVKIAQGDISVAADEADAKATSQDFKTSHWVFSGSVHVRAESQGDLHADRATVEIANGALASASVSGSPAQFQQTRASSDRLVKGHAATIYYDVAAATVKLAGDAADDAWLSEDKTENVMHSPSITYNVRDKRIESDAGSSAGGRVRMTITPKPGSGPGKKP